MIILEEQYQDFYKYVLLPILSYFEVFDETQNDIPTYDEIKIYGDIDDKSNEFIFNQFMLMKIKIVFMALMIILLQLINKILLKNILNNMLLL